MTIRSTLFILLMTLSQALFSQSLPDSIDQLFARWQTSDAPGCAVGIVRGDQLIYAKGFGLANLEQQVPNTPATIFYMCSLSKQFTGYAVARLVNEGKIKPDEDIRTYLPWMSDFHGKKITVYNLLHHTSGIRDDIGLSQYYGLDISGVLTQEHALRILKQQYTLNFNPGEKFSYANSNYVLLAEIVKNVTGKSFREYTDSVIFQPLGMTHSTFIDQPTALIPNRALSYYKDGDQYYNSIQNIYTLGDGGLFTNVNDMAKWVGHFFTPTADIAVMTTAGQLNDSSSITYAMGINVQTDRGYQRLIHNGGLAGFRTVVAVYPALKTGFIVFGNGADEEVFDKVNQLAALLIPDRAEKKERQAAKVIAMKDPARWTGTYVARNGYKVAITTKEDKLYVNGQLELAAESADVFHLVARPAVKYRFAPNALTLESPVLAKPIAMKVVKEAILSDKMLTKYTGLFWSDEVDTYFTITLKDGKLWVSDKYHDPVVVTMLGKDHLYTGNDLLGHLRPIWKKDIVTGYELSSGDIANFNFYRSTSLLQ